MLRKKFQVTRPGIDPGTFRQRYPKPTLKAVARAFPVAGVEEIKEGTRVFAEVGGGD